MLIASPLIPPAGCLSNRALIHISADIISTVEFDSTGNYLATGDKGGRVVLFERNESVSAPPRDLLYTDGGCDC